MIQEGKTEQVTSLSTNSRVKAKKTPKGQHQKHLFGLPFDYLSRQMTMNEGEFSSGVVKGSERKGSLNIENRKVEIEVEECYKTDVTDNEMNGEEMVFQKIVQEKMERRVLKEVGLEEFESLRKDVEEIKVKMRMEGEVKGMRREIEIQTQLVAMTSNSQLAQKVDQPNIKTKSGYNKIVRFQRTIRAQNISSGFLNSPLSILQKLFRFLRKLWTKRTRLQKLLLFLLYSFLLLNLKLIKQNK